MVQENGIGRVKGNGDRQISRLDSSLQTTHVPFQLPSIRASVRSSSVMRRTSSFESWAAGSTSLWPYCLSAKPEVLKVHPKHSRIYRHHSFRWPGPLVPHRFGSGQEQLVQGLGSLSRPDLRKAVSKSSGMIFWWQFRRRMRRANLWLHCMPWKASTIPRRRRRKSSLLIKASVGSSVPRAVL